MQVGTTNWNAIEIQASKDRIFLTINRQNLEESAITFPAWIDSVFSRVLIFTANTLPIDRYGLLSLVFSLETRSDIRIYDKAFNYIQILYEIKYEDLFYLLLGKQGGFICRKVKFYSAKGLILSRVCTIFKLPKTCQKNNNVKSFPFQCTQPLLRLAYFVFLNSTLFQSCLSLAWLFHGRDGGKTKNTRAQIWGTST